MQTNMKEAESARSNLAQDLGRLRLELEKVSCCRLHLLEIPVSCAQVTIVALSSFSSVKLCNVLH